jgi:hypothetical protein
MFIYAFKWPAMVSFCLLMDWPDQVGIKAAVLKTRESQSLTKTMMLLDTKQQPRMHHVCAINMTPENGYGRLHSRHLLLFCALQGFCEFPILVHPHEDVAAAHKLALYEDLHQNKRVT